MKPFWIAVCSALATAYLVFICLPRHQKFDLDRSVSEVFGYAVLMLVLTTVVWAILFRAQLEARRVSLVAIITLVSMLAVLFSAFRYFDPLRIYPG